MNFFTHKLLAGVLLTGSLLGVSSHSFASEQAYEVQLKKEGVSPVSYSKTLESANKLLPKAKINFDGTSIFTRASDVNALLWDVETGKNKVLTFKYEANTGAFSPDGKTLFIGSSHYLADTVYLVDVSTGRAIKEFNVESPVWAIAVSADGTKFATASHSSARVWDIATGDKIIEIDAKETLSAIALNSDGSILVTGFNNGNTTIWNAQTGEELLTLREAASPIANITISPDSSTVFVESWEGARLYDLQTGTKLHEKRANTPYGSGILSPDGKTFLIGSTDGTATLYDADSGDELLVLEGNGEPIYSVGFSGDESTLFTQTPQTITIYNR